MFGPINSVAFDLDGTLVNTMASVAEGMQLAIQKTTGKEIPIPDLFKSFGPSPRGVLAKWLPETQIEEALKHWLEFDHRQGEKTFQPFPGVEIMLRDLQAAKISIGIFTGRDRPGVMRILETLKWSSTFFDDNSLACGDDGHQAKPSGEGLIKLIHRLKWSPERTLMVGDHEHDLQAGREAKTVTAVALWDQTFTEGPTQRARFKAIWQKWDGNADIDLRLNNPESLSQWILKDRKLA